MDFRNSWIVGMDTHNQRQKLIERQLALHRITSAAAWDDIAVNVVLCRIDAIYSRIANFQRWIVNALIYAVNLVLHTIDI